MTDTQSRMWEALRSLEFSEPGANVTFEDKLLRQTGWTRHTAERAIEEYRRFLLLAATAGHPVSPSPVVDEVWHLHLLYTRNYWKTLCPTVLGLDLHHEPATGSKADRSKLDDWYARTLSSYRNLFGKPPPEIWPPKPTERTFSRVDRSAFVVLPRPAWRVLLGVLIVLLALLILSFAWIAGHSSGVEHVQPV